MKWNVYSTKYWNTERQTMSEPSLNIWEKALGWRKRQMIIKQLDPVTNQIRNNTLEEVAQEFEAMKNGGDTTASFAIYVRGMKK
jgi:hypothetical protein